MLMPSFRHRIFSCRVGLLFLFTLTPLIPRPANAGEILFADDEQVVASDGLRRVVHSLDKLPEPVIRGDVAWAQNPYAYGSFIYDRAEQRYRAWYQSLNRGVAPRTPLLYNQSVDGLQWERPLYDLVPAADAAKTNILLDLAHLYSPSVVKLPETVEADDPYRLVFWDIRDGDTYDGGGGMYTAVSADGIHWRADSDVPRLVAQKENRSISDVLDLMYDEALQKYVVYAKCWRWDGTKPLYRMICRTESEDFRNWTTPEVVYDPRADDPKAPQTYGMPVFRYAGQYFGLLRIYHSPGDETIEIELTHSRDGRTWRRVAPGQSLLPVGDEGAWDDGMVFAVPPVVRDGVMRFYYGAWNGPHDVGRRDAAIGLATAGQGRLVALTPTAERGVVETSDLELTAEGLRLNVDARDGAVRVALLDASGKALPGHGLEQSIPLEGDAVDHAPAWQGEASSDLPAKVRLRIDLRGNARLYGVRS